MEKNLKRGCIFLFICIFFQQGIQLSQASFQAAEKQVSEEEERMDSSPSAHHGFTFKSGLIKLAPRNMPNPNESDQIDPFLRFKPDTNPLRARSAEDVEKYIYAPAVERQYRETFTNPKMPGYFYQRN